jgi:hypothetical protein
VAAAYQAAEKLPLGVNFGGFVKGHDISQAAKRFQKWLGFIPCDLLLNWLRYP